MASDQPTSSRITIMLDADLEQQLQKVRGKIIADEGISLSFSRALNVVVRLGMKGKSQQKLIETILKDEGVS